MKKIISVILTVLWMAIIFLLSSYDSSESNNQSGFIVNFITEIFNVQNIDLLSFVIRKLAHLTEYAILGLLFTNMLVNYNKKIYLSIIICFLYSVSDELHQFFVPGRSLQFRDIIIDFVGILFGILMYYIIFKKLLLCINKRNIIK